MIHRALFGSVERFFAILLEHYAGAMPTWLSPVQVAVLPVATAHHEYAELVGLRAAARPACGSSSSRPRTMIGKRIRQKKTREDPLHPGGGRRGRGVGDSRGEPQRIKDPERGVDLVAFIEHVAKEVSERGSP